MPLKIVVGDILQQNVDAIVIPVVPYEGASSEFTRKVYASAGNELLKARQDFQPLPVDGSAITSGFNLKSRYVIHVHVPEWYGGMSNEPKYLTKCYHKALKTAVEHNLNSVAFPLLGTGTNRIPVEVAKKIAVDTINGYLKAHSLDLQVYLVVYHHNVSYFNIEREKDYIQVSENINLSRIEFNDKRVQNYLIKNISNAEALAELIDYDKSNISRFVSRKIKKPNKSRVIAIALAMELSDEERYDFIRCTGHTYPDEERDYIIEEIIRSGKRDFTSINNTLCEINPEFSLKKMWYKKKA
jgi:O-acetyl-ADP-ribose deacetylase (regulator of RNase III)